MSRPAMVILAVILIAIIIFEIWTAVTYGGKPAGEVPFWAFWVLMGD